MIFTETDLKGAFVVEPERLPDERGFFARTWCEREFQAHIGEVRFVQCNISFNIRRGTLRGMHYQASPFEEARLVRCAMGAIYDVIIDLRPNSESFKKWFAIELTAEDRRMLYVPKGFAHGFVTLQDRTEVFYQMSEFFRPEYARGVRWNDPAFSVDWPVEVRVMSQRDRDCPDFS
jgi:dTDP-4-dehydrorhamnose 3,5-epimerase